MKIIILTTLMVVVGTIQVAHTEVEGAALDSIKDAAKSIGKAAAEKADSVTEVPQTGGVIQTALHKGASVVLDKGVDLLAQKYPIVEKAAPHIKKFSKPMLNAAHGKINSMFDKSDTTTVAPTTAETTPTPAKDVDNDKKDDENKPGLMDKLKGMVGKKDDSEVKEQTTEAPHDESNEKKKRSHKKKRPTKKHKKHDGANKKVDSNESETVAEENGNDENSNVDAAEDSKKSEKE